MISYSLFNRCCFFLAIAHTPFLASASSVDPELYLEPKACFIAYPNSNPDLELCLKNINNSLKIELNKKINQLKPRDKIYLLNTKGLYSQALLGNCDQLPISSISKQSCKSQAYISYLNYINQRYLQP